MAQLFLVIFKAFTVEKFYGPILLLLSLFSNGIKICVDFGSLCSKNRLLHPKVAVVVKDEEDSAPVTLLSHDDTISSNTNDIEPKYRSQKRYGCITCKKVMLAMLSSKPKAVSEADEAGQSLIIVVKNAEIVLIAKEVITYRKPPSNKNLNNILYVRV